VSNTFVGTEGFSRTRVKKARVWKTELQRSIVRGRIVV
jgi:hypothetical protein